jgi:Mrp family chromosome partitioning ATPase
MAKHFATLGLKVLLVDGDLRTEALDKGLRVFGLGNSYRGKSRGEVCDKLTRSG